MSINRVLLVLGVIVTLHTVAFAQQGGPYDLTWWTIDGGGITFASGGRYQVGGTVGQPDAHDLQPAGRYTQSGGFWFPCAIASNGDADASGCVNDQDLLIVLLNFGQTGVLIADINCDGIVNDQDLLIVLLNFGQGC